MPPMSVLRGTSRHNFRKKKEIVKPPLNNKTTSNNYKILFEQTTSPKGVHFFSERAGLFLPFYPALN